MKPQRMLQTWGKILAGRTPYLSIEITRECPLRCPGCYAYGDDHIGGAVTLRELRDYRGPELVAGVLRLLDRHRPVHVSIVGGEPLVRYRELDELLPRISARGIGVHLVTSAVRPIPLAWASIPMLAICVSIDGLPPEHDARRQPATYARILKHIAGHQITVHCTVTRQQTRREGYLEEFVRFWSEQPATRRIWMSLYTPQVGEVSEERLLPADRERVLRELRPLCAKYPKLDMGEFLLAAFREPPQSPEECTFARLTHCVTADLVKPITPCQFGGTPDCANCGCMASVGLAALARYQMPGGIPIGAVLDASMKVGATVRAMREAFEPPPRRTRDFPAPSPSPAGPES